MIADLTFENTDKVFPFTNGVWVDKGSPLDFYKTKSGDVFWDEAEGVTKDRNCIHRRKCYSIIAQTPDINIEGVPVVGVEDTAESAAVIAYGKPLNANAERRVEGFIDGYKAAQSKGTFTEEQLTDAMIEICKWLRLIPSGTTLYHEELVIKMQEILQSIRPKIVVMTEFYNDGHDGTGYFKPIEEIKKGRIYFKLK